MEEFLQHPVLDASAVFMASDDEVEVALQRARVKAGYPKDAPILSMAATGQHKLRKARCACPRFCKEDVEGDDIY